MSEILKAADAPLPTKTNGQLPPMTREETEEKVIAFMERIRTTISTESDDVRTQLDNFDKELDLKITAMQDSFRDLFKLVGSFETYKKNVQDTIEEIAKKHLQ